MKEVIIVETTRPQKLKRFLGQEHFTYKVYQEAKHSQKLDIFANYGEAIKNKKRAKELTLWDSVDLDEELNADGEWWS